MKLIGFEKEMNVKMSKLLKATLFLTTQNTKRKGKRGGGWVIGGGLGDKTVTQVLN